MKQKIKLSAIIILMLSLLCIVLTGCDKTVYHWKVEKSVEEISSIEIVDIDSYNNMTVICEIDKSKYSEIIEDIEALNAKKYGWNLGAQLGKCVKIIFKEGMFDLISLFEPQHKYYMENGAVAGKLSWLRFDEYEFDEFIKKWIAS